LVTRAREQASALTSLLESFGANVIEFPAIRIVAPDSYEALDAALERIAQYDWLCFTSVNTVNAVDLRLQALGRTWQQIAPCRVAAIGPATSGALAAHGVKVDYMPDRFLAEAIAEGLPAPEGSHILLARADIADMRLVHALEARGALVDQFVAYRTAVTDENAEGLRAMFEAGNIDVVTFASSSTVRNLHKALGDDAPRLLEGSLIACIGPVTAQTSISLGVEPNVVAEQHTIAGLVKAILDHLAA
jgi:uroporphyrinogen III methyltransferase/synthase